MSITIKHGNEELILQRNTYTSNNTTQLSLMSPTKGPYATISVNMEHVRNSLPPNVFIMPTYKLSYDLFESIKASGYFESLGEIQIGYGTGHIVRINIPLDDIDESR